MIEMFCFFCRSGELLDKPSWSMKENYKLVSGNIRKTNSNMWILFSLNVALKNEKIIFCVFIFFNVIFVFLSIK